MHQLFVFYYPSSSLIIFNSFITLKNISLIMLIQFFCFYLVHGIILKKTQLLSKYIGRYVVKKIVFIPLFILVLYTIQFNDKTFKTFVIFRFFEKLKQNKVLMYCCRIIHSDISKVTKLMN